MIDIKGIGDLRDIVGSATAGNNQQQTEIAKILAKLNMEKSGAGNLAPEMLQAFDPNVFDKIIELQDTFNEQVMDSWKHQNLDWWMAIIDELVEILNSKNWKWWKGTENYGKIDMDNIEVELVDIFHFLLSIGIVENKKDIMYAFMVANSYNKNNSMRDNPEIIMDTIRKQLLTLASHEIFDLMFMKWAEIWYSIGKDSNDLAKSYFIKNALNIHRQKFGYKDGTYEKNWNGKEDNVVAWELARDMKVTDKFFDEILQKLEEYYVTQVQ